MVCDGPRAEEQAARDLRIAQPRGDERENLSFALGQDVRVPGSGSGGHTERPQHCSGLGRLTRRTEPLKTSQRVRRVRDGGRIVLVPSGVGEVEPGPRSLEGEVEASERGKGIGEKSPAPLVIALSGRQQSSRSSQHRGCSRVGGDVPDSCARQKDLFGGVEVACGEVGLRQGCRHGDHVGVLRIEKTELGPQR